MKRRKVWGMYRYVPLLLHMYQKFFSMIPVHCVRDDLKVILKCQKAFLAGPSTKKEEKPKKIQ